MEDLPEDVLLEIFVYLDIYTLTSSIVYVCQTFGHIVVKSHKFWRYMCLVEENQKLTNKVPEDLQKLFKLSYEDWRQTYFNLIRYEFVTNINNEYLKITKSTIHRWSEAYGNPGMRTTRPLRIGHPCYIKIISLKGWITIGVTQRDGYEKENCLLGDCYAKLGRGIYIRYVGRFGIQGSSHSAVHELDNSKIIVKEGGVFRLSMHKSEYAINGKTNYFVRMYYFFGDDNQLSREKVGDFYFRDIKNEASRLYSRYQHKKFDDIYHTEDGKPLNLEREIYPIVQLGYNCKVELIRPPIQSTIAFGDLLDAKETYKKQKEHIHDLDKFLLQRQEQKNRNKNKNRGRNRRRKRHKKKKKKKKKKI